MRELSISEMSLVGGAEVTETQCVATFSAVGWAVGGVVGKTPTAASTRAAVWGIIGGLVCALFFISGSDPADGD